MRKILALILAMAPFAAFASDIEIQGAYVFAPNPVAKNGALFLRIDNRGQTPLRLLGVKSTGAQSADLHTTVMEGEVMSMRPLSDGIDIPAASCVLLERGGFHIMLMGLSEPLVEGKSVEAELDFDNGEKVSFMAPYEANHMITKDDAQCVRAEAAATAGHSMGTMDHSSH